jgi:LPS-assembly lipoprotein
MWSSERRFLLTLLGAGALAGCGFELRRPPALAFRSIALAGFAPRSALADDFRKALARGVLVKEREADAEVVLQALADERSQSVVASTSAAQVRELRLTLKFRFRAHTPAGRELIAPDELLLTRDMSYSETAALAKEQEENELFRVMQNDVVAQVLRRLAAIRV